VLSDFEVPTFSRQSAADGGDVSLTRRPPFTSLLISVRGRVDPRAIVRLQGLGKFKNPMALSGIAPATLRLVA
jgi:hypothetical protein